MAVDDHNRQAWDERAERGTLFTQPVSPAEVKEPYSVLDPDGSGSWLDGRVDGRRVLCLGAGGGRQGVLFAAAGADVTVVDISPAQLERDRSVASAYGLCLQTVQASIDDLSVFPAGAFDLVEQPVSTCYVPSLASVYAQVARVLRSRGLYISQHKTPTSLQATIRPGRSGRYELVEPYYRSGPLPSVHGTILREPETLEYLHRWEEIVGGLCRCGFVVENLVEPLHARGDADAGSVGHRARYIAPYVRVKARRTAPEGPLVVAE